MCVAAGPNAVLLPARARAQATQRDVLHLEHRQHGEYWSCRVLHAVLHLAHWQYGVNWLCRTLPDLGHEAFYKPHAV